jgi:HSP20 family molecular chaperone IbpA
MSLTRQFFREVAPLFRMLGQPPGRSVPIYGHRIWDHFDSFPNPEDRPAIDVTEQGDKYVLDAELPGVSKENVEVRVGDGGRSITIEGKAVVDRESSRVSEDKTEGEKTSFVLAMGLTDRTTAVNEKATQLSVEREFNRNTRFTRTVWLPRSVDTQNISAKLENGVLTILARKAEDKAMTTVPIQ